MNPTVFSLMSALAAAAWSVWTWQSEREKERDFKRNEMSAQYVNTFIAATQELQRLLYKILEEDEFSNYRSKYSQSAEQASSHAIELLYYLSAFFGWALMTFRFGPYTRDSKMIAIMAEIGEVLESRTRFSGDAFRFSLCDRHALGMVVLKRVGENSCGPAFISISRFKFEEEMLAANSEWSRLFQSEEVRCTLQAIDRAIQGEPLEGRERLSVLQNLLVDLLSYLEQQEGFHISFGERGRAKVAKSYSELNDYRTTKIRVLHQVQGRVRLAIPRLHTDKAYADELASLMQTIKQIRAVRINSKAASVVIEYSAEEIRAEEFLETVLKKIDES